MYTYGGERIWSLKLGSIVYGRYSLSIEMRGDIASSRDIPGAAVVYSISRLSIAYQDSGGPTGNESAAEEKLNKKKMHCPLVSDVECCWIQ